MVNPRVPPIKLRLLGLALRTLRKDKGLRLIDVERASGISTSALSRIEKAEGFPSISMARLLRALGANEAESSHIMALLDDLQQPNYSAVGDEVLWQQAALLEYESMATSITSVSLELVPGLLQTSAYARAILAAAEVAPSELEARLNFRARRQQVLDQSVDYLAIIDETVLWVENLTRIAGRRVVVEQLTHIVTMASRQNVDVRVIPYSKPSAKAQGGSYLLLTFKDITPVVHVEHRHGGVLIDEATVWNEIERTDRLRESTLSPADSVELIEHAIGTLEST